jgi:hypothetical protein|tara:strand:+ start:60 stop:365 length:306 start_codon:yes stop_codon:yes gene_type:complete
MNRYKDVIEMRLDRKRNRKRRNSSIIPKINSTTEDIYIIGREGDRLDMLAFEYYEDESLWWVLAEANKLGKGNFDVPPGMRVRIPARQEWYEVLKRREKSR